MRPEIRALELALALARSSRFTNRVRVACTIIPTVYEQVLSKIPALLETEKPDVFLMFGLAGSTPYLRVETRALNLASAVFPDAARQKTKTRILVPGASSIIRVRAPVRRILHAARSTGVKARLSIDAGRYICNAALFVSLAKIRQPDKPALVAFVHIPWPRGRNRRKSGRHDRRPTMKMLQRAAEAILLAVISSARI